MLHDGMKGVQRVLVVLEPGPLQGQLRRWESARQAEAEAAVQEAVDRFQRDQVALRGSSKT